MLAEALEDEVTLRVEVELCPGAMERLDAVKLEVQPEGTVFDKE